MQIVVARFTKAELTDFDECLIAVHFMRGRIVLPFADVQGEDRVKGQEALMAKLRVFMGGTWPVFDDFQDVIEVRMAVLVLQALTFIFRINLILFGIL